MTTTSHALKYNGAPYSSLAELVHDDPKVTAGEGRALCTCGVISPELPNGAARRAWFKEHKAAAAAAPAPVQDVLPETPADEVEEALAELEAPAPKAPRTRTQSERANRSAARAARLAAETPGVDDAASEPNAHAEVLAFSKSGVVPGFWRSLGRDAVKTVVDELYPTVVVTPNNNTQTLHFQGPAEDVAAAVATVKEMWAEALLAVKEWKLVDAGFLGRSTEPLARRREGYHLTEAFYTSFGTQYLAWRQGH